MADTPESLVYRGREGTGAAQVFGSEGNPMRAYYQRKQDVQRKRAIEAEQQRLAKEKRDKKMWEMINVSPDKAFAPFNQQVVDAANNHRKKIAAYFESGGNPDDPNFMMQSKQGWDEVNDMALRTNYVKDVITETNNALEKNPYLNREYYFGKINDLYLDPNGNALPIDQINADAIRNIYITDPLGFNETKYNKDYMDGLNENVVSYIRQKATNNGILTTDGETKWKGNVYTPDPNSPIGVKVDAKGNPIVNVTPEVVNSYLSSDTARRYYETIAQQQGVDVADIIKQRVAGIEIQEKPSFSRDSNWFADYMRGGRLKPDERNIAGRVFEHIDNITNAFFDKQGNRVSVARPEAREAIGHLKGAKYGSGIIDDFELVPGTNKPGKSTYFGRPIDNSPNDRLILKIKSGTAGRISVDDVDITDESAPSALWNRFREGEYMGKKQIAFDQAAEELGVDPRALYKGREYVGKKQIAEQEKVNAWVEGKDVGDFVGKTYRGQPIVGAQQNRSWLGKFEGFTLTLANGNKIKVPKDDYDTFTDIYRSPATEVKKKSTGVKWE